MKLPGPEWFAERFVFAAFGVVLGLGLGAAWLVCIALSGLAGLCAARRLLSPPHMRRAVWLSLLLLLGMAAGQWRLFLDDDIGLRHIAMQESDRASGATVACTVTGETLAPLEYCGFGSYRIPLRLSAISLADGTPMPMQGRRVMLVILKGSENSHLLYILRRQWGVSLRGKARIQFVRTLGNPGAFDPSTMYLNRHCHETMECNAADVHIVAKGLAWHPAALLQRFRVVLGMALRRYLSEEGAAIANGIALGEVSSLRDKRVRGHDIAGSQAGGWHYPASARVCLPPWGFSVLCSLSGVLPI